MRHLKPVGDIVHGKAMVSLTTAAFTFLAMAGPVYAEDVPKAEQSQTGWISVVVAVALVICVGIGCFMSPKRTHQD